MNLEKYKTYKTHTSIDSVLSNWIFIFFILYVLGFKFFNPLFLLLLGILSNIIIYILLLNKKYMAMSHNMIYVNTIIKVLPAIYLRNTKITKKDIYISILILIIWFIYVKILYGIDILYEYYPTFFDYYIMKLIRYLKQFFNKKI